MDKSDHSFEDEMKKNIKKNKRFCEDIFKRNIEPTIQNYFPNSAKLKDHILRHNKFDVEKTIPVFSYKSSYDHIREDKIRISIGDEVNDNKNCFEQISPYVNLYLKTLSKDMDIGGYEPIYTAKYTGFNISLEYIKSPSSEFDCLRRK